MFGYIIPDKPELKIKEFELFRAYYCGLCKSMGRSFGLLSRFALNYDSTFLGLLLSSLHKEEPVLKREGCIANPVKKKFIVKNSSHLDYAADINVLLTYYKLIDNIRDEGSPAAYMAKMVFVSGYKRAASNNPLIDNVIKASIAAQLELENRKCSSVDEAAEPSANMMKHIIRSGYRGNDKSILRILEWTGYNLGRWIYIIDAYDDLEKDIKSASYNSLALQYGFSGGDVRAFKANIREDVRISLIQSLSQASGSLKLLELNNRGIIDNIMYEGLYKKTEMILNGCNNDKRSWIYRAESL
ncbi:MAG: DUF5685 family protein [Caulobacteraceae bacterium]